MTEVPNAVRHNPERSPAAEHGLPVLAVVERRAERTLGDVAKDLRRELALLRQSNREALSARGLERLVAPGRER